MRPLAALLLLSACAPAPPPPQVPVFPRLESVTLAPGEIDTSGAERVVTASLSIIRAGAAIDDIWVRLGGPVYSPIFHLEGGPPVRDEDAGIDTFVLELTIPRWSEEGRYDLIEATLFDARREVTTLDAAALRPFDAGFMQVGLGDQVPPELFESYLLPVSIDTSSAAQTVAVHVHAGDVLPGVGKVIAVASSPGGAELGTTATAPSSGTREDGRWKIEVQIPAGSAKGTWKVDLAVEDAFGNRIQVTDVARFEQTG